MLRKDLAVGAPCTTVNGFDISTLDDTLTSTAAEFCKDSFFQFVLEAPAIFKEQLANLSMLTFCSIGQWCAIASVSCLHISSQGYLKDHEGQVQLLQSSDKIDKHKLSG